MASDELHVGVGIPRHTARQIYLWAKNQQWPPDTDLEEPKEYHITLLYSDAGNKEHKDAWWLEHLDQAEVTLTGITAFPSADKGGYAYVLLIDSPEISEKAEEMQARAESMGLSITHFPGGYKPHITVAYGSSPRLQGIKVPNFQFDVGASSVSPIRAEKESRIAYGPDEIKVLDHLSLQSVAANLHYKFEEGGLDAAGATDYAQRLLKMIGYPPDELTTQAAIQAWQQQYPEDRVLQSGSEQTQIEAPPTTPTGSWGYGTTSAHKTADTIPPEPGTAPIPDGNIRLWHYTGADPEIIRQQGLRMDHAQGENYGEPNQIWASARPPAFDNHNVVEFSVPRDDPRWNIGKYEPYINYSGNGPDDPALDYGRYLHDRGAHVTFHGDIRPDEIHAVHEPWHQSYHYLRQNYPEPSNEFDWAFGPNTPDPNLGRAVQEWKKEALTKMIEGPEKFAASDRGLSQTLSQSDYGWREVDPVPGPNVGVRQDYAAPGTPFVPSEHLGHHIHGRDTGHFGTGLYFVSTPEAAGALNREHVRGVDLTGRNLYRPRSNSDAYKLHDNLSTLNDLANQGTYEYDRPTNWGTPIRRSISNLYNLPGWHTPEGQQAMKDAIDATHADVQAGWQDRARWNADTASTRFMRAMGYDGIDTRHLNHDAEGLGGLDNTQYGSVLYRPHPDESRTAAIATSPLYHWVDVKDLHNWMDPSHTGPGQTYLTTSGTDPSENPDIPAFENPVRLTIDPSKLDQNQFDQNYHDWLGNYLYHGVIPPEAIADVKAFKRPTAWDDSAILRSTVPSEVNNPDDHIPEWGDRSPDQETHDVQFSNDWTYR